MGEAIDTIANFLLFGGGIALAICGFVIAKPNLHGLQFIEGTCKVVSVSQKSFYDDLPTCSCSGKNCNEEYPCIQVEAEFTAPNSSAGGTFTGCLHHDYAAVKQNCLFECNPCSSSFEDNVETVFDYYREIIFPLLGEEELVYPAFDGYNDLIDKFSDKEEDDTEEIVYNNSVTFDCWGHVTDKLIYMEHTYSKLKVILSLGVPAGACLLGILLSVTVGSHDQSSEVLAVLGLPFILIFGIFGALWDCFKDCCPDCQRRPTPRRATPDMLQMELSSGRRRRSATGSFCSAGTMGTVEADSETFRGMFGESVREQEGRSGLRVTVGTGHDHGSPRLDPSPWSGSRVLAADPPSYRTYDTGHVNPPPIRSPYLEYNPSSGPPGPSLSPGYTDTSDMPPPPAYDDVVI